MNLRGVLLCRARLMRNLLLPRGLGPAARGLASPLASLAFVAIMTWILAQLMAAVLSSGESRLGLAPAEVGALVALAIDLALLLFFVVDLETAVSVLILDRDLDLLRRAPLSPSAILAIKLVDALPRTAMVFATVMLPALIAFVATRPFSPGSWLALPLVFLLLWSIPVAIGTALSLGVIARVPARLARESLGLVSSLAISGLWLANVLMLQRAETPGESELDARFHAFIASTIPVLERTPGGWAVALLDGVPGGEVAGGLALVLAAATSVALLALAASRHLAAVLVAARTPVAHARRIPLRLKGGRGPFVVAMLRRDVRFYLRDWKTLGDLLFGTAVWVSMPLLVGPLRTLPTPRVARSMLVTLAIGLGVEIASRSLPLERRAVAWSRLSPLPAGRWVTARLATAALVALAVLAVVGALFGWQARMGLDDWLQTVAVIVPALTLAVASGLWLGAAFGDPDWIRPGQVLSIGGRLVSFLLMIAQTAGWLFVTLAMETVPAQSVGLVLAPTTFFALGLAAVAAWAVTRRQEGLGQYR